MKFQEGDLVEITSYVVGKAKRKNFVNVGDIGIIVERLEDERYAYPYKVKSGGWSGVEVFMESELQSVECEACESKEIYSSRRKMWLCPFCKL